MQTGITEIDVTELYNRYSYDILAYSASLLKNHDDAQDALQEVFIRFIKSRESFKEKCSVKSWLLIITRNYCYSKLNGRRESIVSLEEGFLHNNSNKIESGIVIREALSRLSPEDYELLYLKEYAGYSYDEISEILEISVSNAKVKLFRIRQQLKELLK